MSESELPKRALHLHCHGCKVKIRIRITAEQYGKTLEVPCPKCQSVNRVTIPVLAPKPEAIEEEINRLKTANPLGYEEHDPLGLFSLLNGFICGKK